MVVKKASEFDARVNANASLTSSEWDSLKLDELRKTIQDLDYNHPIRNSIEQHLLNVTRLNGMGKRIVRDPYNPFPKIPRSKTFRMSLCMLEDFRILLGMVLKHQNYNTAYLPVRVPSTRKVTLP